MVKGVAKMGQQNRVLKVVMGQNQGHHLIHDGLFFKVFSRASGLVVSSYPFPSEGPGPGLLWSFLIKHSEGPILKVLCLFFRGESARVIIRIIRTQSIRGCTLLTARIRIMVIKETIQLWHVITILRLLVIFELSSFAEPPPGSAIFGTLLLLLSMLRVLLFRLGTLLSLGIKKRFDKSIQLRTLLPFTLSVLASLSLGSFLLFRGSLQLLQGFIIGLGKIVKGCCVEIRIAGPQGIQKLPESARLVL